MRAGLAAHEIEMTGNSSRREGNVVAIIGCIPTSLASSQSYASVWALRGASLKVAGSRGNEH